MMPPEGCFALASVLRDRQGCHSPAFVIRTHRSNFQRLSNRILILVQYGTRPIIRDASASRGVYRRIEIDYENAMLRAACEGNSWRPWLHRALCATVAALTVSLPVTPALGQQSAQPRTAFTNQPAAAPSAPNTTVPVDPKRAKQAYARGREAEKVGDWRGAYEAYAEAARELPEQREYVLGATSHAAGSCKITWITPSAMPFPDE